MAGKEFEARIRLKRDTSANWTANNPVLLHGERILVDTAAGEVRTKTGDGAKTYTQLPFDDEEIYNIFNKAFEILDKKGDASRAMEVTLYADAWADGKQTVTVSGLQKEQNGLAALPQNFPVDVYELVVDAQLAIFAQEEESLTFSANGEVPQIDIPVIIILLG